MIIDGSTLLIGIAFSSLGLLLALFISWLNARNETYLIYGTGGIALMSVAPVLMALRSPDFDARESLVPFVFIIAGFTLILASVKRQRDERRSIQPAFYLGAAFEVAVITAFLLGYSGIGTIVLNIAAGVLLFCSATEHRLAAQGPKPIQISNYLLFVVTAISFLCCAAVLIVERQWVLTAPVRNWAEDFNSIMCLVGLSGIGAFTLTFHHARSAQRMHILANTDALTGMLNRRAIFDRFQETTRWNRTVAIMMDLDHFKQINDQLGHAAGDRVLQSFARVVQQHTPLRAVASRLGGEEFCCVLTDTDPQQAETIAENIRRSYESMEIQIGDSGTTATVSIGIAVASEEESFSALLNHADAALYQAKRLGRNRVQPAVDQSLIRPLPSAAT